MPGSDGGGEAPMVCGGTRATAPSSQEDPQVPARLIPGPNVAPAGQVTTHRGSCRVFSLLGQQPQHLASTALPERSLSPAVRSVPSSKAAPLSLSLGRLVSQASSHFPGGTGGPQPVHTSPV